MKVPLLDLKAQYAAIKSEVDAAIAVVMESQHFILGPKVEQCEKEIARYSNCSHAVGVSSGSDALIACLMAENIGPGDEVITTPYTFFATAGAIARLGAIPVFVDIDPETYNMDAARIESKVTAKTRAIMPVHLYGQMADMDTVMAVAEKHKLIVIEDGAQGRVHRALRMLFIFPVEEPGSGGRRRNDCHQRRATRGKAEGSASARLQAEVLPQGSGREFPSGRDSGGDCFREAAAPGQVDGRPSTQRENIRQNVYRGRCDNRRQSIAAVGFAARRREPPYLQPVRGARGTARQIAGGTEAAGNWDGSLLSRSDARARVLCVPGASSRRIPGERTGRKPDAGAADLSGAFRGAGPVRGPMRV
jgi:hypothetical protein